MRYGFYLPTRGPTATRDGILSLARTGERLGLQRRLVAEGTSFDALRTGHPSVGSGTRLAMQDAIALFDAFRACEDNIDAMLADFERCRRPGSGSHGFDH